MISNELLSKVLKTEVKALELWNDNSIRYFAPKDYIINIYELANKCKEWALNLDEYSIESGLTWGEGYVNLFGRYSCSDSEPDEIFVEDTEPEAIFKACEYILKNQG